MLSIRLGLETPIALSFPAFTIGMMAGAPVNTICIC
ncbi:MAG: hypothetical protein RL043_591, partial [Pseudomonadota bacterium]